LCLWVKSLLVFASADNTAISVATTRCALNFPVVAVSTILQELRFLVEAFWPAVDEIVA
jgi:hypothetical protein